MKKFFLFLLIVLTVFALVACKDAPASQEPEPTPGPSPEPEPEPTPDPEPVASVVYTLTAGSTGDRFQVKWADEEFEVGQVVSFKFKGITLKEYTIRSLDPASKIANCASFSGEPDSDGWYSFSYEVPDYSVWNQIPEETPEDPLTGLGLSLFPLDSDADGVVIAVGDVLRIKDLSLNGNELSLAQETSWPGVTLTIAVEE